MSKKAFVVILFFVQCVVGYGQFVGDSIHEMFFYEIMIKMKNRHSLFLYGISKVPVLFHKHDKNMQVFVDNFYSQAFYCVDPCLGVYYLPSEIIGDKDKYNIIINNGNFDKIYSSCKFKLKDCVIYVDKYMIRTKVFVTDDFHFTSVTPGWLISRYYKNKYLLYELEPMHQLPIFKNEIIKVR